MKNIFKQLLIRKALRLENELNEQAYGISFVEANKEFIETFINDMNVKALILYVRMNRLRLKNNKIAFKLAKIMEPKD